MNLSSKMMSTSESKVCGAVLAVAVLGLLAIATPPAAAANDLPPSLLNVRPDKVEAPLFAAEAIDRRALIAEDETEAARTPGASPLRFAVPQTVSLTPETEGLWTELEGGWSLWRLETHSSGALSLYSRIENFDLPRGAKLWIYDADGAQVRGPFTAADKGRRGGFTSPIILGERMVFEVLTPSNARDRRLFEVTEIYRGYQYFGEDEDPTKRGSCNINVVCPEGDAWRDQIRSVARYVSSGWLCTGTLVNNTAQNDRPFFLTAGHCNVDSENAHAAAFYWNHQSSTCEDFFGGDLSQFQTGATLVAAWGDVGAGSTDYGADMKLLELDAEPDEVFNVHYAGWDVSSAVPQGVVGIHHPQGDPKSISFEDDPVEVASYIDTYGDSNWLRVNDWDLGTTEGGSSGSCIFDQSSGLCVGTLSGGWAACGNDDADWYGWLHRDWEGGGTSDTQLKNWLDPANLGVTSLLGKDPGAVAPPADTLWLVPAAASAQGSGTSNWKTQINVANPSAKEVTAGLFFVEAGDPWPGGQLSGDYTIPAGGSLFIDDVLAAENPTTGLMYVSVDSTEAVVTTRTYNLAGDGSTFGQGIPGIRLDQSKSSTTLILPMVHSIPKRYRANLGLVQTSSGDFRVRATVHNQAGQEIASKAYRNSAAFTQINGLLGNMNLASAQLEGGWIELTLTLGSPAYWTGYVSIIDEDSDDGTYIMAVVGN